MPVMDSWKVNTDINEFLLGLNNITMLICFRDYVIIFKIMWWRGGPSKTLLVRIVRREVGVPK